MRHQFFRLCGDLGWTDGRDSGPFLCCSGDVVVIKAVSVTETPDLDGMVARAEARAKVFRDAYAAFKSTNDDHTSRKRPHLESRDDGSRDDRSRDDRSSQEPEDEDGEEDLAPPNPVVQLKWPADYLVRACDDFYLALGNRGTKSIQSIFNQHFRPHGVGPEYHYQTVHAHLHRWKRLHDERADWCAQLRERDDTWQVVMAAIPRKNPQRDNERRRTARRAS